MAVFDLPAQFRFGVSTSATQIEGAAREDGRGTSIWDSFADHPGHILDGSTPTVAADHYHRYREDVELIAELGVDDYRFSIAWPRIVPDGDGEINTAGLDFYDRLVDALLEKGVRPVPTLYHWDLPLTLQHQGGWMTRNTAHAFARYTEKVAERLSDRVTTWLTLNEMSVHTLYGHALTEHAPGLGLVLDALPAAHHQLLGHGLAVQALRAAGATTIGVPSQHFPVVPASTNDDDVFAATMFETLTNWLFSDPILLGTYPSDEIRQMIRAGINRTEGELDDDLATISQPLDMYGVNYYEPTRIAAPRTDRDSRGVLEVDIPDGLPFAPVAIEGVERTDFGWAVVPSGLTDILITLRDRYPQLPPLIVTESGASYHDRPDENGAVHDERRIRFLEGHLGAVRHAIAAGVDVRGFYVWSILDNFEWAAGYREQFGLVFVDWTTLERTRKDSWFWYRDTITASHEAASA